MKIYVASSWRNDYQPDVVRGLRQHDHEVYDFRNPDQATGFHWSEIDPEWKSWTVEGFIEGLSHPLAEQGFANDFTAMKWADACVLVLPCGQSAHLEAGHFVASGKPLLILLDRIEPELMYKMADSVHNGLGSVLMRLQEIEDAMRNS